MARRLVLTIVLTVLQCLAVQSNKAVAVDTAGTTSALLRSDSFANAIGVCTHFSYVGTPYVDSWEKVSASLIKSGIRYIRDGGSEDPGFIYRVRFLGQHGIKYATGWNIQATPELVKRTLDTFKPYVDSVEPANEYDVKAKADPDWQQHLEQEQRMLYGIVRANPNYLGITVLGPAMAHTALSELPQFDAIEDAGNLHSYLCRRDPSPDRMAMILTRSRLPDSTKPIWTTETGYGDNTTRNCWLPDDVIAKYDMRIVAESLIAGQQRVFFYQFSDTADPGFGAYGLIDVNGNPKPQYIALTSLISLLSDPGGSFPLKPLQYEVTAPTANVDHLLLQKRNGQYELLLWQEVRDYRDTYTGGVRIPISPVNVDVAAVGVRASKYLQFDTDWRLKPVGIASNSSTKITIPVSDTISVLELR